MKILLVDTNTILRFLLKDVSSQYKIVVKNLKEAKNGKLTLVIPEIIVFESFFVLTTHYKYSKEKVIKVLEALISSNYFDVENREILLRSLKIYKSANLSLVDSYLAARSAIADSGIFTFDKKLEKYAKNS